MIFHHKGFFFLLCIFLIFFGFTSSCAHQVNPTGGEKDHQGPVLVGMSPPERGLFFGSKEIVFTFDEFLKPGSYSREVFISPLVPHAPEVLVVNKKLIVKFKEGSFAENTTYVVTVGVGLKDFHEGNPIGAPIVYAFSTGGQLDTLTFHGTVQDAWNGQGLAGITVLVFDQNISDSNGIFGKTPTYVSQTDQFGNYKLQYLKEGTYKVFAVKDADQSFSYNQEKEMIGFSSNPSIKVSLDTNDIFRQGQNVKLTVFTPDQNPPSVKTMKWLNKETIQVQFSEALNPQLSTTSFRVEVMDTMGNPLVSSPIWSAVGKNGDELLIQCPQPPTGFYDIELKGVMDTLGNGADSLVRLNPRGTQATRENWFSAPILEFEQGRITLQTNFLLDSNQLAASIFLKDSNEKAVPFSLICAPFMVILAPQKPLDFNNRYQLEIPKGLQSKSGLIMDTTYSFPIKWANEELFGSFSGKISLDTLEMGEQWVMLFIKKGREAKVVRRVAGGSEFHFSYLEPGNYGILLIKDQDRNGCFTPGALFPYRMPEEIWRDSGKDIEIRAKWELENYEVKPVKVGEMGSKKAQSEPSLEKRDEKPSNEKN